MFRKKAPKKVLQIDASTNKVVSVYPSLLAAAAAVGVKPVCIRDSIIGRQKTSKGFRWEYAKLAT